MNKKRVIYFDCFSGISGDMILGSLVDLGVDIQTIREGLEGLCVQDYKLKSRRVKRNGISATKVNVVLEHSSKKKHHHSRSFTDIRNLIKKSQLPEKVKSDSIEIFHTIGKIEAQIHRTTLNKIHFHELGSIDSIVDITGGVLGLSLLNVDSIYSSPLNTGEGVVKCEHGMLPVPAPATLKLLRGIPCYSNGTKKELTTPTGAAMIRHFAEEFRSMPNIHILEAGYGAGKYELKEIPNLLRAVLGEIKESTESKSMKVIETNIDDMNPEFYEHVMGELFKAGAVDVFYTPIYMKKNRPGILLTVLIPCENYDSAIRIILTETSTFGIRYYDVDRTVLAREEKSVKTSFGKVRVKIGFLDGEMLRTSPEYDDCRRIASRKKIPVKKVYEEVLRLTADLGK